MWNQIKLRIGCAISTHFTWYIQHLRVIDAVGLIAATIFCYSHNMGFDAEKVAEEVLKVTKKIKAEDLYE